MLRKQALLFFILSTSTIYGMSVSSYKELNQSMDFIKMQNSVKECVCGANEICSFKDGVATCDCEPNFTKMDGVCTECKCSANEVCSFKDGVATCDCEAKFTKKDGVCTEFKCGVNETCDFKAEVATCKCMPNFIQKDGVCIECDCGPQGVCSFEDGVKICECEKGFTSMDGFCLECDCGPKGVCSFEDGVKMCDCEEGFTTMDGFCLECDCGPQGVCSFEDGVKICECVKGFTSMDGSCSECDCGSSGMCSFVNGLKRCECKPGFSIRDEICSECDCGPHGECGFYYDEKWCKCEQGFLFIEGGCIECNCGSNGTCSFEAGEKECICSTGFEETDGICKECNCGQYGHCSFDYTGKKICDCPEGFLFRRVGNKDECAEKCFFDDDCQNGGECNAKTSLCECRPGTSGDKCEKIEGCRLLKCEEFKAECIFNLTNGQPTCRCLVEGYVYKNGKCNDQICTPECNDAVSRCDYSEGVGICRCNNYGAYYDYSAKTCKQIDKCITMECKEGICRNGVCVCPENYIRNGSKCEPKNLCDRINDKCFPGASCEEGSTFGYVKCLCKSSSKFYNPRTGKCDDGSCFLPGRIEDCKETCPPRMIRHKGECRHNLSSHICERDCGYLGWCYKFSNTLERCVCDPHYAELDKISMKCVLKASAVCPSSEKDGDYRCRCTGKYKVARNGITCELKSCSDEDVQEECKSKGAAKCVDNWKKDTGYKCICPEGYIDDRVKGCVDQCSRQKIKDVCHSHGQLCYIGDKYYSADCRCPPTFNYDENTKSCDLNGANSFMIYNLPVLRKKYENPRNNINKVLLSIDVITSMKQTFNNLDFANIFSFRVWYDVLLCDVWLQFKSDLPSEFDAGREVRRLKFQTKRIMNQTVLPPAVLLGDMDNIEAEELTLCSNSVQELVCGKGSTCSENMCDCAPGFRTIESTVKLSSWKRILRCEDIDECSENTHYCSDNTICINTPGDFYCLCKPGYRKEGYNFYAMNKKPCTEFCNPNPCGNGTCIIHNDFSLYCKCDEGFSGPLCDEIITTESYELVFFIGIFAFFCLFILVLSGTLCYICLNKKKI